MIYLGADHGGFQLKEKIKAWLSSAGKTFEDLGASTLVDGDDYPQYAFAVAQKVSEHPTDHVGILVCRSGGGMAIAANRVKGVRAVDCISRDEVLHAREHNDANVLTLPAEWVNEKDATAFVELWLNTAFSGDQRHVRRIAQLDEVA